MPSVIDFTGEKARAAGWYGHTQGLHTVAISVHNFQGRITLQGSQVLNPSEADWFTIALPADYPAKPYIEFPRSLISKNLNTPKGETSTIGFSFRINCLWLRAKIERAYLLPVHLPTYAGLTADNISWLGNVDSILVNF